MLKGELGTDCARGSSKARSGGLLSDVVPESSSLFPNLAIRHAFMENDVLQPFDKRCSGMCSMTAFIKCQ